MIIQSVVIICVMTLMALQVGVTFKRANLLERKNIKKNQVKVDSIYNENHKLDLKMDYYELKKSQ